MHREQILQLLARYVPLDSRDDEQRRRIETFVREHPDCFNSDLSDGHVTGSAWLLDSAGERVLLTHHRKLNRWLQLGGHADGECDLHAVALREAREESGINEIRFLSHDIFDLDVHPVPQTRTLPLHFHFDIRFLLQVTGKDEFVVSDESHALGWFTPEQIATMELDESVQRMCEKWRRFPEKAAQH